MTRNATALLLALVWAVPADPGPAIPFFTNLREVRIAAPDRQNYLVVDPEIWQHARPDLADLRLFDGDTQVGYAYVEQRAGISSVESEAKILNLGSVGGHTEFDLDIGEIAQYDRIRLRLDAKNFVATAAVSGGNALGQGGRVELGASTLYDFTRENLGSSFVVKLPASSFRYLHIKIMPAAGIRPQQVKGAAVYNLQEQKAKWTNAGSCAAPQPESRRTVIACEAPARVPLDRIQFQVAASQVNFRRTVSVANNQGLQLASGEISRVRLNRGGTAVTSEELAVNIPGRCAGNLTITVDNADNAPLAISRVQPLSLERRLYFDSQGKTALKLYYGDQKLFAPVYDYARFFHADPAAAQAELEPGMHNPAYTGRPDERPWSERHMILLWLVMLLAVAVLAALAIRGLKTEAAR